MESFPFGKISIEEWIGINSVWSICCTYTERFILLSSFLFDCLRHSGTDDMAGRQNNPLCCKLRNVSLLSASVPRRKGCSVGEFRLHTSLHLTSQVMESGAIVDRIIGIWIPTVWTEVLKSINILDPNGSVSKVRWGC